MREKYVSAVSIVVFAAVLCSRPIPGFASILDSGDAFAVLGSSTVSNTGSSTVTGDVGLSPGPSIVGFAIPPANVLVEGPGSTGLIDGPGLVTGTIRIRDGLAGLAQTNATAAWTGLKNMPFTSNLSGQVLGDGGTLPTLTPGVYHFDTSAQLTGALTLDAEGNNNAFWVFQTGTTLKTASASSVALINPGANNGVFWQVGSSATLGTTTSFVGNILADQSVTLTTGANITCGRAFALNAAVTMDTNNISIACGQGTGGTSRGFTGGLKFDKKGEVVPGPVVPEPATMLLFGLGGLSALGFRRRLSFR